MVSILYPGPADKISGAFMVVAQATDNVGMLTVDLSIDDQITYQASYNDLGYGLYYLMVPEHLNTKGIHSLKVIATDISGNKTESKERFYTAKKKDPNEFTAYEKAVHLSQKFCYGAEQEAIAEILLYGDKAWLDHLLEQKPTDPAMMVSKETAEIYYPDYSDYGSTPISVISYLSRTQNPLQARFVLWAQNHFTTWLSKVTPIRKRMESNLFFDTGLGNFKKLLYTSATSPSMIFYLDQQKSFVGRYNENYARELMELHTVGVSAGYTQEDVTALAKLLTGWMQSEGAGMNGETKGNVGQFIFEKTLNDNSPLQVFGYDFPSVEPGKQFDRVNQIFEMLATHPKTAERITAKILAHYVGESYSKNLHQQLQTEFLRSGSIKNLLRLMATSEELNKPSDQPKIISSFDYAVGFARKAINPNPWEVHRCARSSGVGLFDRITPDGYPETNDFYSDPNALLQRWKYCDNTRWQFYSNIPERSYSKEAMAKDDWIRNMIQITAMRAIGCNLTKNSYDATLDFYQKLTQENAYNKAISLSTFICKLPEANLR